MCLRALWLVSRWLLMFAFKAIVFIEEFSLLTPMGANLNQLFFWSRPFS